jgi:hypothetical protein
MGNKAGRGLGSADLVASVWAFSAVFSSLLLFSSIFFRFGSSSFPFRLPAPGAGKSHARF